ncbi:hypothetical protein [Streptomyces sp. NPDC049585]|uniref:hypothetical protein n=1 Tax=Streptomyces sp. NPDC049585 TaxID=3155154 RepID=UPI003436D06F
MNTDPVQDSLNAIAAAMRIVPEEPGRPRPGEPLHFHVTPPVPPDLETVVTGALSLVPGDLSLTALDKKVSFGNPALAIPPDLSGNLDIAGGLPLPPGTRAGNTAGVIAQAAGKLPSITGSLPLQVDVPLTVEVVWSLFVLRQGRKTPAVENRDFAAPLGLRNTSLEVLLAPPFYELTQATLLSPPFFTYSIRATVTLTANVPVRGPVSSQPTALPDISLAVPGIGIPTVSVFFRHSDYQPYDPPPTDNPGWAFVVLPTDTPLVGSPTGSLPRDDLLSTISRFADPLQPLAAVIPSVALMLGGFGLLAGALRRFVPDSGNEEEPRVGLWIRDRIDDLNDEDPLDFGIYQGISSLILVSAGRDLEVFNEGKGSFRVFTSGQGIAAIRDLNGKTPIADPAFTASTGIAVTQDPDDKFNDRTKGFRYS